MATAPQKVRHEWYQTDEKVVVELFIKNAENRHCKIDINSHEVTVRVDDLPDIKFNLLYEINTASSSHKISSVKIELTLIKLIGHRWATLEKTSENADAPTPFSTVNTAAAAASLPEKPVASDDKSKSGVAPKNPKDWDKLVKNIWEEEDLEKSEGDALNSLFQKIYTDSNPDIQRAMNKSFTESGGTVLSTNWNEVKSGKVEVKPPDGTEYQKWKQ